MHTLPEPLLATWQHVWRHGLAPLLSTAALQALRDGLARDDPALIQGATTMPPHCHVQDRTVDGACVIGYLGRRGEGLETIGEVEQYFGRMCFAVDGSLGQPAASRWLLNYYDDTPRAQMVPALLAEVELSLAWRQEVSS